MIVFLKMSKYATHLELPQKMKSIYNSLQTSKKDHSVPENSKSPSDVWLLPENFAACTPLPMSRFLKCVASRPEHCLKSVHSRSYSVQIRVNADQTNSEYAPFSMSGILGSVRTIKYLLFGKVAHCKPAALRKMNYSNRHFTRVWLVF